MNFSTPELVASIIQDLKDADLRRAPNRSLINGLFNGDPPYTAEEEQENGIQVNINWKSGTLLLHQAREQFEAAHLHTGNFFTITVPDAPPSKVTKINNVLTRKANAVYKNSRAYLHAKRDQFGSVVLHGPGPLMYEDEYGVFPHFVPVADLLVPTNTELTLDQLSHFARRREMSAGKLYRKTIGMGDDADKGWDLDAVKDILQRYADQNQNQDNWNWYEHPEKLNEIWKQNATYYDSDAVPKIRMWDFFYQKDFSPESCWYRVILLDDDCTPGASRSSNDPLNFIFKREEAVANNTEELMQVMFGDGSIVPPHTWWGVRSLGWLLYDVCSMMNRLQCQFTQKVFEDLMLLFRVQDPADRSRLEKIYMGLNYGIIPEGLSFVKNEERYKIDPNEVEMLQANFKQLMGESTSTYTQDIDQGTKKERTAYEVQALLTQTAKLTGSILNLSYEQAKFEYRENCRRLTLRDTVDFRAKKFQEECKQAGVPDQWIDSARWEVEPERVLGQGNMQLEQAQAKAIFDIRGVFNPTAQQKATHDYVFAITHDPKRTEFLAPLEGAPQVTDSVHDTELVFSAFMSGTPITPKPGTNPIEVVQTMLRLIGGTIQGVMKGGGVGTPQQAHGLDGAILYTKQYIAQLAQDEAQKQLATDLAKKLSAMENMVKAMHQRQQQQMEAAQKRNGGDPEAQAKLQAQLIEGQQKLKQSQAEHQQRMQQEGQAFAAEQQRKNIEALTDVHNSAMEGVAKAHAAAKRPVSLGEE